MKTTIFSMTGYGEAQCAVSLSDTQGEATQAVALLLIELRSVNARFLDITFRMPDECRSFETMLREQITRTVNRGKVECRVQLQRPDLPILASALDDTVLKKIQQLTHAVQGYFPQVEALRMSDVLRWPGLLREPCLKDEVLAEAMLDGVQKALGQLCETRLREGTALTARMLESVESMLQIVKQLKPLVPILLVQHQQKLTEKLNHALQTVIDNREELLERVCKEVTVYGMRIDVAEELTRLETHLRETRHILSNSHSPIGKRLDFMMQELNREANTLGSKATAIELANAAIDFKLLIEQLREQAQNLE